MQQYLESSEYIDWTTPAVYALAKQIAADLTTDTDIARACFELVRDEVKHSWDYQLKPVTCKASEVLQHKTGYCYAKSHLLAALLRANKLPAGLCYQRLSLNDDGEPYCLHGLNAVFLKEHGWYRIDARGNKQGIDADFTPPTERLAFPINFAQERDFPEIWARPLPEEVDALSVNKTILDVYHTLPDIEVSNTANA